MDSQGNFWVDLIWNLVTVLTINRSVQVFVSKDHKDVKIAKKISVTLQRFRIWSQCANHQPGFKYSCQKSIKVLAHFIIVNRR